jgi:CRP/FNR family cyclic AMP-dependent transcriptional regulator
MPELVSVLDYDHALAELVPAERLPHARHAAKAVSMRLRAGSWGAARDADRARGGYGLLVLEGLLVRRVGVEGRFGAELLGPGDLLRPWQHDGDYAGGSLPFEWTWRVVAPTHMAILDLRWAARVAQWPQIGAELAGRALERSLRMVIGMAIAQQPKLEIRLWLLFWALADRWGRVHPDGIHIDLPLTHETLSHLAAARRPSVSGALARLADDGKLRREGRTWVLTGEPPADDMRGPPLSAGLPR